MTVIFLDCVLIHLVREPLLIVYDVGNVPENYYYRILALVLFYDLYAGRNAIILRIFHFDLVVFIGRFIFLFDLAIATIIEEGRYHRLLLRNLVGPLVV